MKRSHRLRLILGDQLSFDLTSLQCLNTKSDTALLVEVMEEASHVPHHPQKNTLTFSAMRHFAEELQKQGIRVEYVTLEDPKNSNPTQIARLVESVPKHHPASFLPGADVHFYPSKSLQYLPA